MNNWRCSAHQRRRRPTLLNRPTRLLWRRRQQHIRKAIGDSFADLSLPRRLRAALNLLTENLRLALDILARLPAKLGLALLVRRLLEPVRERSKAPDDNQDGEADPFAALSEDLREKRDHALLSAGREIASRMAVSAWTFLSL